MTATPTQTPPKPGTPGSPAAAGVYADPAAGTARPARPAPSARPGFTTLLRELRDDVILLAKQEFALARTETARNASVIGTNIGKAAAYGALALVGVLLILVGLSLALGYLITEAGIFLSPVAAAATGFLIFGAIVTLIFAILLYLATKKIKETHALPQRSMDSLNADANLASRAASGR